MNESKAQEMLGIDSEALERTKSQLDRIIANQIKHPVELGGNGRCTKKLRRRALEEAIRSQQLDTQAQEALASGEKKAWEAALWLLQLAQYRVRRRGKKRACPEDSSTPASTFANDDEAAAEQTVHAVPDPLEASSSGAKILSPSAHQLYRAFLITDSEISGRSSILQANELSSHARSGTFTEQDWAEWLQFLEQQCHFDPMTQSVVSEDRRFVIDSRMQWQAVCILELEKAMRNNTPLEIYFTVISKSSKPTSSPSARQTANTSPRRGQRLRSKAARLALSASPPPGSMCSRRAGMDEESTAVRLRRTAHALGSNAPQVRLSPGGTQKPTQRSDWKSCDGRHSIWPRSGSKSSAVSSRVGNRGESGASVKSGHITVDDDNDDDNDDTNKVEPMRPQMQECEQAELDSWSTCARFFRLGDGDHPTASEEVYYLRGLKSGVTPRQLHTVFRMLLRERGLEGDGSLDSDMHLDEADAIVHFFVELCVVYNYEHVKRASQDPAREAEHLSDCNQATDTANLRCPSQKRFPILCRCVQKVSMGYCMEPLGGATLVAVPESRHLVAWAETWAGMLDAKTTKQLHLQLLVGHHDATITARVQDWREMSIGMSEQLPRSADAMGTLGSAAYMVVTTADAYEQQIGRRIDQMRHVHHKSHETIPWQWRTVVRQECSRETSRNGCGSTAALVQRLCRQTSAQRTPSTWLLSAG